MIYLLRAENGTEAARAAITSRSSFGKNWNMMSPPPGQPITVMKQCRHGKMIFLTTDRYIGTSLDKYGEYCESEAEVFTQLLSPGDTVVEIGANIGAHTIHLAQLVGPEGKIYAFEPQRVIFQLLCGNIALNELFNVYTFQAGAGETAGTLKVPFVEYRHGDSNFGAVSLLNITEGDDVPIIALDSMNFAAMRLLKIDAEGMECPVIEGARQQILRHRPVIYVENDRKQHSEKLISLLHSLGYNLWWHFVYLYHPKNFLGVEENIFADTMSVNMVCVPTEHHTEITGLRKVSGPTDWWENPPS